MSKQIKYGFTLLELLIVIGILAILSAVTILVINPAELLRKSRDTQRISDLGTINSALAFYLTNTSTINLGSASNSYSNVTTTCSSRTAVVTTSQSINSTGWLPVDLSTLAVGSPISKYPIDPNPDTTGSLKRYYVYLTDGVSKWELAANLESNYYTSTENRESKDGGTIEGLYEVGNKLDLIVRTDNCFNEVYALRDTGPAGGLIFYDQGAYINGWRYLEAAPASTQWSGKVWSSPHASLIGTNTGIGTGKANTTAIVAVLGGETDRAAQLCDALSYGGYNDWFLPSYDETSKMYVNLKSGTDENGVVYTPVGGFVEGWYWSSSERTASTVWRRGFHAAGQYSSDLSKASAENVRAVRSF